MPKPNIKAAAPAQPEAMPTWRDPWAWAVVAGVVPLVLHSLGAPLGDPVAEDFDFLHRALLEGHPTLLDGGGSSAFWRPLSHQIYYWTLGTLALSHPRWVAALHLVLLALGALLLYRVLRRHWPGPAAAAAASFPLLAESTRTAIAWSSDFVDLGVFLFSAVALHEAAFRRLGSALVALLLALWCKELAVVTALLLPWLPSLAPEPRRTRWRWALATLALVACWGIAYLLIRRHFALALPHGLESELASAPTALTPRFAWAAWNSLRAILSLQRLAGPWDLPILIGAGVLVGGALFWQLVRPGRRLAGAGRWTLWGGVWFLGAAAMLIAIFPMWTPHRSQFVSVGLGIALVALLGAAHPTLVAALVALRLVAFALAPAPPRTITPEPPDRGSFMDFERLVRLQRLMEETRRTLADKFPSLPPHARVCQHHLPLITEYAFGGNRALHVWYRDTTLRWVRFNQLQSDPGMNVTTIVEYQPKAERQIVLVEPAAMRRLLDALVAMRRSDCRGTLAALDAADSLQPDSGAKVFLSVVAGKRSLCLPELGQRDRAVQEARRSLALWSDNDDGHYALAYVWLNEGRLDEAEAQADSILALHPKDANGLELREKIRSARRSAPLRPR